jgi:hypothetical protein
MIKDNNDRFQTEKKCENPKNIIFHFFYIFLKIFIFFQFFFFLETLSLRDDARMWTFWVHHWMCHLYGRVISVLRIDVS